MGGKSKRMFVRTSPRRKRADRQAFIDLFNANPCNKLPGAVLQSLYRKARSTRDLNARAEHWLKAREALLA